MISLHKITVFVCSILRTAVYPMHVTLGSQKHRESILLSLMLMIELRMVISKSFTQT